MTKDNTQKFKYDKIIKLELIIIFPKKLQSCFSRDQSEKNSLHASFFFSC